MKYSINVDNELKIIRYKHSGEISADEIGQAWQELLNLKEFTHLKYNLLSDYRKAKFNISIKKVDEIVEFMQNIDFVVRGKKQAMIVDNPYNTATSMIFEADVYKKVGFFVNVFTTESAALNWLQS